MEFWSPSDDDPRSTSLDYPGNRIGVHHAGDGSNLRPELSGLLARLFAWRLHRLQLYLYCPMQCDGLGTGRDMLR